MLHRSHKLLYRASVLSTKMENYSEYDDLQRIRKYQDHRLRVINLYEADMELLWGYKQGKSMRTAVQENILHPGKYGILPGRDCTAVTFFKKLQYEYARLTRYPFSNFDNDATACYDRILLSIASLCGLKFGLHQDIVFIHKTTLEEA